MIKKIFSIFLIISTLVLGVFTVFNTQTVAAYDPCETSNAADGAKNAAGCNDTTKKTASIAEVILKVLYWIIFTLAVIMIIIGGITYATSAGDPGKVQKAKWTIIVAVVGLIIAFLATTIINVVLDTIIK